MSINLKHLLIMGRSVAVNRINPGQASAAQMHELIHPKRMGSPAAEREVPPTVSAFYHDPNYTWCEPTKPGEEGDPQQSKFWDTYGLPTPGETTLLALWINMANLVKGWAFDVYQAVPGLVFELLVVKDFNFAEDGSVASWGEEVVVGEFDASKCGASYLGAAPKLKNTNDGCVFTDCNWYVLLRIKSIDNPAQIKCARFQLHQLTQCVRSQAPLIDNQADAEMMVSYPGLGAQMNQRASVFETK